MKTNDSDDTRVDRHIVVVGSIALTLYTAAMTLIFLAV